MITRSDRASKRRADSVQSHNTHVGQTASDIQSLYAAHYRPLVKWLNTQYGSGPPEPEDVAQKVFANLSKRDTLSDIDNPQAFLWRSAKNIFLSEKRAEKTRTAALSELEQQNSQPGGDIFDPCRVLQSREMLEMIIKAVEGMPERRRRVFMLRRFEGLSYKDIGRRLGMTKTNVSKQLAKATLDINKAYAALVKDQADDGDKAQ